MKPSKRDVIEWARTVWPGVFRGPDPLYNGYVEFAELAYAAGRKAGMEEAQSTPKPSLFDAEGSRCRHGVLTAQQCCWSCHAERDATRDGFGAPMETDK